MPSNSHENQACIYIHKKKNSEATLKSSVLEKKNISRSCHFASKFKKQWRGTPYKNAVINYQNMSLEISEFKQLKW